MEPGAQQHSGLFANDILRTGMNGADRVHVMGGSFQFEAAPWQPSEPWERYEARVLSQMQEAFTGYGRYIRTVMKASGALGVVAN